MSKAEQIVDALLEADPEKFMQDYGKRWHAEYFRDENG